MKIDKPTKRTKRCSSFCSHQYLTRPGRRVLQNSELHLMMRDTAAAKIWVGTSLLAIIWSPLCAAQFATGAQLLSGVLGSISRGGPGQRTAFANNQLPDVVQRNQQNTANAVASSDNAIVPFRNVNNAANLPAVVPRLAATAPFIPASGIVLSSITDNQGNVIVGSRLERRPPPVPAGSLGGLSASQPAVTAMPLMPEGRPNPAPAAPAGSTVAPPPTTTFAGYLVGSPYPFVLPPPDIPYFGSKWNGPWGYPLGHYQAFRGTGQYITHYQYYPLSYYGSLMAPFAYGISGK